MCMAMILEALCESFITRHIGVTLITRDCDCYIISCMQLY